MNDHLRILGPTIARLENQVSECQRTQQLAKLACNESGQKKTATAYTGSEVACKRAAEAYSRLLVIIEELKKSADEEYSYHLGLSNLCRGMADSVRMRRRARRTYKKTAGSQSMPEILKQIEEEHK